ncbi:hypothetical protein, partial [Methylogaea oryzae]|uniref:hypothetical protein n=1 Tax=Methylogaea oryzae TaxID=1295382 RepID=UPI0012E23891
MGGELLGQDTAVHFFPMLGPALALQAGQALRVGGAFHQAAVVLGNFHHRLLDQQEPGQFQRAQVFVDAAQAGLFRFAQRFALSVQQCFQAGAIRR